MPCTADLHLAGSSLNARKSLSNRLESLSGNSEGIPMPVVFPTVHYSPRSPTAPWPVSSRVQSTAPEAAVALTYKTI